MPDTPAGPLVLWRAFVPRWAHTPLSGAGAAAFGGRWNPIAAPTIHAARELSTAWAEYNQGFVQHPALIARLELADAMLAELTDPRMLRHFGVDVAIHNCQWHAGLDRGEVPATHALREKLLERGYDGVVYPSVMSPGGSCVALWRWNGAVEPSLKVVDPEGRVPKSAASWL